MGGEYSELLFNFGHLQSICATWWPENMHPWAAIFLADFLRGITSPETFEQLFHMPNSDYYELGQCILVAKGHV